jgi:hypothetical protein
LKKGEIILRVPKGALLSVHSAQQDKKLAEALVSYPSLSSTQVRFLQRPQGKKTQPLLLCERNRRVLKRAEKLTEALLVFLVFYTA